MQILKNRKKINTKKCKKTENEKNVKTQNSIK